MIPSTSQCRWYHMDLHDRGKKNRIRWCLNKDFMPIEMIWQRKQDLFQKKLDFAFNGKKKWRKMMYFRSDSRFNSNYSDWIWACSEWKFFSDWSYFFQKKKILPKNSFFEDPWWAKRPKFEKGLQKPWFSVIEWNISPWNVW